MRSESIAGNMIILTATGVIAGVGCAGSPPIQRADLIGRYEIATVDQKDVLKLRSDSGYVRYANADMSAPTDSGKWEFTITPDPKVILLNFREGPGYAPTPRGVTKPGGQIFAAYFVDVTRGVQGRITLIIDSDRGINGLKIGP
jgi:hypothetical protein